MPRREEIRRNERAGARSASNSACRATTKAGKPCPAPATADGFCPMHSPRYSEQERKLWRARGHAAAAKARHPQTFIKADFSTESGIRRCLEEAGDLVRAGRLPVSQANAFAKLAATALKAAELRHAEELARLEAQLQERGGVVRRRRS